MSKIALLAMALSAAALAQRVPPVPSARVNPDRTVTFRLEAPKAADVRVSGDLTKGAQPLTKDESGVWSLTIGPLAPAIYTFNFILDGVRVLDPTSGFIKPGVTGNETMLEVPDSTPAFYDARPVPHGAVHVHWYDSKAMGAPRSLYVYTPPGYDAAKGSSYPTLYLLHGSGDTETCWVQVGRANFILDNLLAEGKLRPMVVVMPFGHPLPGVGLRAPGAAADRSAFATELIDEILPMIEKGYRVSAKAEDRAIAGLSMGGGQALNIGLANLDRFAWIGVFSMGVRAGQAGQLEKLVSDGPAVNRRLRLFWIACGKQDGLIEAARNLSELLEKHGVKHSFTATEGIHEWIVWRNYLRDFAPLLFQPAS